LFTDKRTLNLKWMIKIQYVNYMHQISILIKVQVVSGDGSGTFFLLRKSITF
ncbi:hypothetical protein ACJX0J_032264, partial [Zea mays]